MSGEGVAHVPSTTKACACESRKHDGSQLKYCKRLRSKTLSRFRVAGGGALLALLGPLLGRTGGDD